MPTRRGRAALAAGAVIFILAILSAIHELYTLAVAAFAFPLAAVVFVRVSRSHMKFARTLTPARVFAGNPIRVHLQVQNTARVASPPLVLDEQAPTALGGPRRASIPALRPRADESFVFDRPAVSRGRRTLPPLRARLVDPFGLAEMSRHVTGPSAVTVYPRIEVLHERAPREARSGTGRSSLHRLATGGDDFYAVREWQDGDDLRRIHWRSSARRGELMIRQDEVRPFPRATILVDTRTVAHPNDPSSLEWGISAAASLVWELASQGFALRVATADSGPGGARWGREAVDPLLTALALAPLSNLSSLIPSVKRCSRMPGAGGAFIVFLPVPSRDLVTALARAGRAYEWRGAVLLDIASFTNTAPRERAAADQRVADAERALMRAGWRVDVAGSSDRFAQKWQTLLDAQVSPPASLSPRS